MKMPFPRLSILLVSALGLAIVAAACFSGSDNAVEPTAPVFLAPPWPPTEDLTYNVTRRGESPGTCILKTEPAEAGRSKLSRLCGKDEFRDDGFAVVDAETLRPFEATRVFADSKQNKRTTYTSSYADELVRFQADVNGDISETERELPLPGEEVTNPGWYDDESILWLVRGINLTEGYESEYTLVINAGQPRVHNVEVLVQAKERVSVPAGDFEAWKVRLRRGGSVNYLWIEAAAPNRLIRAAIEDVSYELRAPG